MTATISVSKNYPATKLISAGDPSSLVMNTDSTNSVYIGDTNSIEAGDLTQTVALGPGASFLADGTVDKYGIVSNAAVAVDIMTGAEAYNPGTLAVTGNVNATVSGNVNVANTPSVSISGTPTIAVSGNVNVIGAGGTFPPGANAQVDNAANVTVAPMAAQSGPVINVSNYLGYNVNIQAYVGSQNVSGAALALNCVLTWYADAAGTIPLYRETWETWLGNSLGNLAPVNGAGQMHGPYMRVTFSNPGSASNVTIPAYTLWGTQRLFSKSDWRQTTPSGMNAGDSTIVPLPTLDGSDGILAGLFSFIMPVSVFQWLPLPLMAGPMSLRFESSQALANDAVVATAAALLNGNLAPGSACPGVIWAIPNVAGQESTTELIVPNSPLLLAVKTTSSGATISFAATSAGP